jgi:hypothetical protein
MKPIIAVICFSILMLAWAIMLAAWVIFGG